MTGGAFGKGPRKSPRLAAGEEPCAGEKDEKGDLTRNQERKARKRDAKKRKREEEEGKEAKQGEKEEKEEKEEKAEGGSPSKKAKETPKEEEHRQGRKKDDVRAATLFVGNLPFTATVEVHS